MSQVSCRWLFCSDFGVRSVKCKRNIKAGNLNWETPVDNRNAHICIGEMFQLVEKLQRVHSTSSVCQIWVSESNSPTETSVIITAQDTLLLHVLTGACYQSGRMLIMQNCICRCMTALGITLTMLRYVTVKTFVLTGLTGMHKRDCSKETRLVLLVPSSSWAGKRKWHCILTIIHTLISYIYKTV